MARLVKSGATPVTSFVVQTILEDNSIIEKEFKIGDMMTNLRYIENQEIITVTGKLSKVNYNNLQVIRNYGTPATLRSHFADDVLPVSIEVDCSEQYASNVVVIPCNEIVEDLSIYGTEADAETEEEKAIARIAVTAQKSGVKVKRMKTYMKYGINFTSDLTDGSHNDFTIWEGQDIQGLTYMDRSGDVTSDVRVVTFAYDAVLSPTNMIVIENGLTKNLDIIAIKSMGTVIVPSTTESLATDIVGKEDEAVMVALQATEYSNPITLSGKVTTIRGAWAGINAVVRKNDPETFGDETVISGKLTIPKGKSIILDGVTITGDAKLWVEDAESLELRNCIIAELTPENTNKNKDYMIRTQFTTPASIEDVKKAIASATATKLVVKNCYFGNNAKVNGNYYYNGFELTGPLADGSIISGCYFEKEVASNNIINLYNIADGALVTVRDNMFEISANAIRVGAMGDSHSKVDIINNTYDETVPANLASYAGLLLIQPYGNKTETMANVVIRMVSTVNNSAFAQLYYVYYDGSDTVMSADKLPTLTIDGEVVMAPTPAVS